MTAIVAAAIVLLTTAIGLALRHRHSAPARSASGFTLQTLIVTAVLVLVAVGATAIFIALSRSNEDTLEDSSSDMEAREAQHGVIDPTGNLSYTWRCSLHEEYVLNTNGEAGTCQTRCYAKFDHSGATKWNRLVNRRSDLSTEEKTALNVPVPPMRNSDDRDNGKAFFFEEDFGEVVYSESDPSFGELELRGNGTVIALDGTCILTQKICSFNEQSREALIRRWENSIDRSLSGRAEAIPIPSGIIELRTILEC